MQIDFRPLHSVPCATRYANLPASTKPPRHGGDCAKGARKVFAQAATRRHPLQSSCNPRRAKHIKPQRFDRCHVHGFAPGHMDCFQSWPQTIFHCSKQEASRHSYTQTILHTDTFTHRSFYTQKLLPTEAFTHRGFYTQTPLHTDAFTHRRPYIQTLLHTDGFTHRRFCT